MNTAQQRLSQKFCRRSLQRFQADGGEPSVVGCASVGVADLVDLRVELDVLIDEPPHLVPRPAATCLEQVEVFNQLLSLSISLEASRVSQHRLAAGVSIEDEQTELIRLLECFTGFIDGLPRDEPGRAVAPCVKGPGLDVAVGSTRSQHA